MYEVLFDEKKQDQMRDYFLNFLSKSGANKKVKKGETLASERGYIGIVIKGKLCKNIVSSKGKERLLYVLRPGEILGEMSYFCGGSLDVIVRAKDNSEVSLLSKEILDKILIDNPEVYKYFIHSMTRKYRIVTLELTNATFNDSYGKIADALLRISACVGKDSAARKCIPMNYTHQELANNIGCSRITVTKGLSCFCDKDIIEYDDKQIIIKDEKALIEYIDTIGEE